MPNETFEEHCINIILPKPCHPKLSTVPVKHETQCLAITTHLLLHKRMFNTKVSQATIAHEFRAENKKLHMAILGRKYNPGKKPSCKKATPVKQKATQKKSTADLSVLKWRLPKSMVTMSKPSRTLMMIFYMAVMTHSQIHLCCKTQEG